jgi:hypothetical protein
MAKRLFATMGLTFTPNALGSLTTASTYMGIRIPSGGGALQLCDILEVLISGTLAASGVGAFFLVRSSTLSATPTALANPQSDGPAFPGTSALVAANVIQPYVTATTQPTLSNAITDAKLNLGLNAFGGILRWNAAPTQQWQLAGVSAPGAETVLANLTAGGGSAGLTANAHIMYEPS